VVISHTFEVDIMNNPVRFGSAIVAFAFAGAVFAQAPAGAAGQPSTPSQSSVQFGTVDANKDGRISQAEADSHSELKTQFSTLDADRDSHLSQTEFTKWKGKTPDGSMTDPAKAPPAGAAPRSESEAAPQAAPSAE
jgi:hypothetical protein